MTEGEKARFEGALNAVKETSTSDAATEAFMNTYEGPGTPRLDRRTGFAAIARTLSDGVDPPATAQPSTVPHLAAGYVDADPSKPFSDGAQDDAPLEPDPYTDPSKARRRRADRDRGAAWKGKQTPLEAAMLAQDLQRYRAIYGPDGAPDISTWSLRPRPRGKDVGPSPSLSPSSPNPGETAVKLSPYGVIRPQNPFLWPAFTRALFDAAAPPTNPGLERQSILLPVGLAIALPDAAVEPAVRVAGRIKLYQ